MADDDLTPWTHEVTGLRRLRRRQLHYLGHAPPEAYPEGHRVSRTASLLDLAIQLVLLTVALSALCQLPFIGEPTRGFIATLPHGLVLAVISLAITRRYQRQQREEADPGGSAST